MNRNFFDDFSMTLIHRAEHDCAEHDPAMADAAAMVLVGDVYALLVCRDDTRPYVSSRVDASRGTDALSPFIR